MPVARIIDVIDGAVFAAHPDLSFQAKSTLSASVSDGGTALTVYNNDGFNSTDFVLIGNFGEEKSEIKQLSAVNANKHGLTVGAVDHDHPVDTPITQLYYDQVKFDQATSETGTYSTSATVTIQADKNFTSWRDIDFTTGLWYQVKFYRSVTAETDTSTSSDAVSATGYKEASARNLIKIIRRKLKTSIQEEEFITDEEIMDILNEGEKELEATFSFQETTTTQNAVASQQDYTLPTDYKPGTLHDLRFTSGSNFYYPEYIERKKWILYNTTTLTSSIPTHFTIFGGSYSLYPIPSANGTNVIKLWYSKKLGAAFSDYNDTSTVPNYMVLVYYALKEILADLDEAKFQMYEVKFQNTKLQLIKDEGKTQKKTFTAVEDIGREKSIDPNRWTEITEA